MRAVGCEYYTCQGAIEAGPATLEQGQASGPEAEEAVKRKCDGNISCLRKNVNA